MTRCTVAIAVSLGVFALASCASGPHADPVPGAPTDGQMYPDPLDLAAAHIEAMGGREAVEAVRGYYATGTEGIAGEAPGATVEKWVRPGEGWRKRWDVDGFGRVEHGFDGRIAWLVRPDRPADAVRDEQYGEAAASRAVLHPETDLTTNLGSARTIGQREIAGRSTWEVRVTGPAGSVQSRFYDNETGMLRAVERTELLAGQLTRIRTVYDDWRPVEGVLFPHRLTRTATNGPERVTMFASVRTEPVPPEAVRPPAEVVAAASEERYEVEVERDVVVPMRDGVGLATDIHRPRGVGDHLPAILIRTPYDKSRDGAATVAARVFAERGYVVVVQDERGKWASEGEFSFEDKQSFRNDGFDTVEWLVSQPWSNGRVGTYGCSRRGVHQYMLAAERHPAHYAMIPQAGSGAAGPQREGGAFPLSAAVGWHPSSGTKDRTDGQVPIPLPEALHHLPTVDIMRHYGVGPTDWENLLTRPLHDPWWQTHGYVAESDSFATPALHVNSWYDLGVDVTLQLFDLMRRNGVDERTREYQYVIISPTTHCRSERATENTRVGELDVGDARLPYWQIYLRWFNHWLKGIDNGVTDMPRVQYYVTGANEWRSADEWPVPEALPTRFYLRSGGAAGERMDDGVLAHRPPAANEPPDRYVYDPADPVPSRGGSVCCTGNPRDQPGAFDQSDIEQRADVLVYTTPPLDDPLEVIGALQATLYVSSSAPDTDFTVKLVDVHPDGRAFNVQEGITRARYREGFDRTVWMRPGEVYEVDVDLHATAHRFRAGHRVRIEVSSSNFPRFDRNLNTGGDNVTETEWRIAENAIHHSPEHPSHVLLPVVAVERDSAAVWAPLRQSPLRLRHLDVRPEDAGYVWLEDLRSDTARQWADAHTSRTRAHFASRPVHDSLIEELRSARAVGGLVLQPGVVPPAIRTGPHADRIRAGVWMRQPWERFERGENDWLRVLDLDSLSTAVGARVDVASIECLPPAHDRCLLLLSRGGGSRLFDLREYDVPTRSFVNDGFELGPAQTSVWWRDSGSVYIATQPMGRAQRALIWRRGEALEGSDILFHADPPDGWGAPRLRGDQGVTLERRGERLLLRHIRHQYDIEYYLVRGDEPVRLPVPRDVREILFVDGQLVVQLRSAWQPGDESFPAGSLIGIDLQAFLDGSRAFRLIMPSSDALVVDEVWSTRSLVLVRALVDMKVRLLEFRYANGAWESRRIDVPEDGTVQVRTTYAESDRYYFTHEDFLRPRTALVRRESGEVEVGGITEPAFPAEPYTVDRWHATSADGTRVPYFVVRPTDVEMDGRNPVIIKAYGGNGISMLPEYLGLHGPTWLRRGGIYVLANIRGGNEYGVEWHYGVRRENRQRAFGDFQAVAADLVERGVTSPGMIGTHSASNGGILVGISFIQRPALYGAVWANNGVLELHRCSQLSGVPPVGERGDGQDPGDWAYMRRYSPFHNLEPGEPYPAVLLTANRADDIVHPCHSRKFTAKLEDLGYPEVFFYETGEGGHGKAYNEEEEAMILTFFLTSLHPDYSQSVPREADR